MPVVTFYGGPLDGEVRAMPDVPACYAVRVREATLPGWRITAETLDRAYRRIRTRYRCTEGLDGRWRAVWMGEEVEDAPSDA